MTAWKLDVTVTYSSGSVETIHAVDQLSRFGLAHPCADQE